MNNQTRIMLNVIETITLSLFLMMLILIFNSNVITQATTASNVSSGNELSLIFYAVLTGIFLIAWRLKKLTVTYKYFVQFSLFLIMLSTLLFLYDPTTLLALLVTIVVAAVIYYELSKIKSQNIKTIVYISLFAINAALLISPLMLLIILIIFSIYDIIAVRLGLMQKMAAAVINLKLPLIYVQGDIKEISKKITTKTKIKTTSSLLGGGDVLLPLALIISAFIVGYYVISVIFIALTLIGIFIDFKISGYYGKAIAALPVICALFVMIIILAVLW